MSESTQENKATHACGRLQISSNGLHLFGQDEALVSDCSLASAVPIEKRRANTKRILDCWNACEGIPDPTQLRKQRDDLLAMCKLAMPYVDDIASADAGDEEPHTHSESARRDADFVEQAIANVTSSQTNHRT